jgi:L-seryl-tRNA(Ser) seleniumtransferase
MSDSAVRGLPSVDKLLSHPILANETAAGHELLRDAVRQVLDEARAGALAGSPIPDLDTLAEKVVERARDGMRVRLGYVVNATGVVLHTGLGRARLCDSARRALDEAAKGHSLLETVPETGRRGSRYAPVRELLMRLTGAEDAHVVNNNAAAVMLCVNTVATGKEAIISRGQCVEIGGSFRMPDVIRAAGATLVDVGTTNRTRLSDYENAITENTGCIIRCHPSNFTVVGFAEEVGAAELARLGKERGIPVIDDVGSGCLVDTERLGVPHEPTLRESLEQGADLVTGSGDKLLGGPQAGLVLGSSEWVQRVARNPIARAVRCDKLALAAMEATLREYLDTERVFSTIPTLRYIGRGPAELGRMAGRLRRLLKGVTASVVDGVSEVGGGSLPGCVLPTRLVRIEAEAPADELARRLRLGDPPVFARIVDDHVCLDPRTLEKDELALTARAVASAAAQG